MVIIIIIALVVIAKTYTCHALTWHMDIIFFTIVKSIIVKV